MISARPFHAPFLLFVLLIAPAVSAQSDIQSGIGDREDISITVYHGGIAMVRDLRRADVGKGVSRLELGDVSAQIIAPSAILEMDGVSVIEQNFDYDLLTPGALVEKAVGREVRLYRPHPETGEDRIETARILAANGGIILDVGGRIEILDRLPRRIVFTDLPPALKVRPTLSTLISSTSEGARSLSLSYLTGGVSWQADYAAMLAADGKSMDIRGWVTLGNMSGTDFADARVAVMAGEINRVQDHGPMAGGMARDLREVMVTGRKIERESLADYHLYSLPNRTTIANNQTKQVALFDLQGVRVAREYRFESWNLASNELPSHAEVWLVARNDSDSGLGQPLPEGVFRVYARDGGGTAQFIGEDRLPATAPGDPVAILTGKAFDVTVTASSEDRELLESTRDRTVAIETQSYRINNGSETPVRLRLKQNVPARDWELIEESMRHDSRTAEGLLWSVEVPARGEAVLRFRVRTGS